MAAEIEPQPKALRPKTKKEAIQWNKYNGGTWDWFPIRDWPRSIASYVMKQELGDRQRFATFVFFVGNGMPPSAAVSRILEMQSWNRAQRGQIEGWLKRLHKFNKYTYWDMKERRSMQVNILKEDRQESFTKARNSVPQWEINNMIARMQRPDNEK